MGFRFRKSVKIAPGIKLNIGKKSTGISIGNKSGGISFNTRTGARARASIPGTGISYSSKLGSKKRSSKKYSKPVAVHTTAQAAQPSTSYKARPKPSAPWYRSYSGCWILGVLCFALGIVGAQTASLTLLFVIAGIVCIILGFKGRAIARRTPIENDVWTNLPAIPLETLQETLCPGGEWKQLVTAAQTGVPQWERIATDCLNLMAETISPDTYFSRYELLREQLCKLTSAECVLQLPDPQPSERAAALDDDFEQMTTDFIMRSYQDMADKAQSLKTENGRRNRRIKYYSNMFMHADYLTVGSMERLTSLMESDGINQDELVK